MNTSDISLLRLHNLLVSSPVSGSPAKIVRWLCASQAQDSADAIWALGLRLKNSKDVLIEMAFNSGSILRTMCCAPPGTSRRPTTYVGCLF